MTDYTRGWRMKKRGGKGRHFWYKTILLRTYCIYRVGLCQWQVACGNETLPGITSRREAMEKARRHAEKRLTLCP